MKKINIFSIVLFFTILAIPLLMCNLKPDQTSEIDNRKLAELPIFGQVEDFTKSVEGYVNDRIGLRTEMINAYTQLNDKLFHVMIHPSYEYGKDGYVFFKLGPEAKDFEYIEDFANFVGIAQNYCEERGATFLYALEPSKITTYSQYLRAGAHLKNERINLLVNLLEENGTNFLYTNPLLKEASETQQVFDVKYDAGHWNENGAFLAISAMLEELNKSNPKVDMLKLSDYNIEKITNNSLKVSHFSIHEESVNYVLKNPQQAVPVGLYNDEIRLSSDFSTFGHYKNREKYGEPKILIFRGSYFSEKEKFLVEQFSETVLVHNYVNVTDLDYYFNLFKPDIVLFESTEYATHSGYFPQAALKNASYNPAYDDFEALPTKKFAEIKEMPKDKTPEGEGAEKEAPKDEVKKTRDIKEFSYLLEGEEVAYAYAKVRDEIYDFKVIDGEEGQKIEIFLANKDVVSVQNMEIILISKDEERQHKEYMSIG